jgi:hypothetical protein
VPVGSCPTAPGQLDPPSRQGARLLHLPIGHREDVWTSPQFQTLIIGGITWALGDAEVDTTPNIHSVTPQANELPSK